MDLKKDHFSLFGLEQRFRIDSAALERTYKDMQATVHPDRHASLPEAQRRVSMQWAARLNEAYRTLRAPLSRAQYLLQVHGIDVQHESNTVMPADFLMEQMEWREAVAEARAAEDAAALESILRRLREHRQDLVDALEAALDEREDWERGADLARRLMFLEKLNHDIDEALVDMEG